MEILLALGNVLRNWRKSWRKISIIVCKTPLNLCYCLTNTLIGILYALLGRQTHTRSNELCKFRNDKNIRRILRRKYLNCLNHLDFLRRQKGCTNQSQDTLINIKKRPRFIRQTTFTIVYGEFGWEKLAKLRTFSK